MVQVEANRVLKGQAKGGLQSGASISRGHKSLQVTFNIGIKPSVKLAHRHITLNPNILSHAPSNLVVS